MKIVSIDLKGDYAFFKNPQFNGEIESKHYSFDSIHKMSILGMFGSLLGMGGLKNKNATLFPEYYDKLSDINLSIQILNDIKKEWLCINSASGMFSKETGGILNLKYDLILDPSYRIYIELDMKNIYHSELYDILSNNYLGHYGNLYFGKTSYPIDVSNFKEYGYNVVDKYCGVISSLFLCDYSYFYDEYNDDNENSRFNVSYLFDTSKHIRYERQISIPNSLEIVNGKIRYSKYVNFNHTNKEVSVNNTKIYKLDKDAIYLF